MRKFKYSFSAIVLSIASVLLAFILAEHEANTGPKVPDEGLEYLIVIPFAVLIMCLGLAFDLFFIFTRSNKPLIKKRKHFWQIIGALVLLGIIYSTYVLIAT